MAKSRRGWLLAVALAGLASLGAGEPVSATVFSNPAAISIPDSGPATPYPSDIVVSGLGSGITALTVTLNNVSHTYPGDIDVLLVGPGGQNLILVSDAGEGADAVNVTVTFDDASGSVLPDTGGWGPDNSSVTSRPVDYGGGRYLPGSGPRGSLLVAGTDRGIHPRVGV